MNAKKIAEKLLSCREKEMTAAQKESQRVSFAYGNTYIENDEMTREAVEQAAKSVPQKD
jgi:hypothetical protein